MMSDIADANRAVLNDLEISNNSKLLGRPPKLLRGAL